MKKKIYIESVLAIPGVVDSVRDIISEEKVIKEYNLFLTRKTVNIAHDRNKTVEALVKKNELRDNLSFNGYDYPDNTWVIGFETYDEEIIVGVESGNFIGLSLEAELTEDSLDLLTDEVYDKLIELKLSRANEYNSDGYLTLADYEVFGLDYNIIGFGVLGNPCQHKALIINYDIKYVDDDEYDKFKSLVVIKHDIKESQLLKVSYVSKVSKTQYNVYPPLEKEIGVLTIIKEGVEYEMTPEELKSILSEELKNILTDELKVVLSEVLNTVLDERKNDLIADEVSDIEEEILATTEVIEALDEVIDIVENDKAKEVLENEKEWQEQRKEWQESDLEDVKDGVQDVDVVKDDKVTVNEVKDEKVIIKKNLPVHNSGSVEDEKPLTFKDLFIVDEKPLSFKDLLM